MTVWQAPMTQGEREAVAEILAASWPWEPHPGFRTCEEHAAAMEAARRWNEWARDPKGKAKKGAT